jgi:hypothetical protein
MYSAASTRVAVSKSFAGRADALNVKLIETTRASRIGAIVLTAELRSDLVKRRNRSIRKGVAMQTKVHPVGSFDK